MTSPTVVINATVHIHIGDTEALRTIIEQNGTIIMSLTDLAAAVAENTQVDQSAITLIEGIADQIDQLGIDNAELDALTAQLRSSSSSLASTVSENTPAAPTEQADPEPTTGDAGTDAPTGGDAPGEGDTVSGDAPTDATTPTDEEIAANVDSAIESDAQPEG